MEISIDGKIKSINPIGQGIGEYNWDHNQVDLVRKGIDLGMNFIDTAESYGDGHSEKLVGIATKGLRDQAVIATKFSPENSSYNRLIKACEGSLRRLKTDYIDVYQMHWPNSDIPFDETLKALHYLKRKGMIKWFGLGNIPYSFDFTNISWPFISIQMEYNLFDPTIEIQNFGQKCKDHNKIIIAYSPLDHGRIADNPECLNLLNKLSEKYEKTPAQIAFNWIIKNDNIIAIPKASSLRHLEENANAMNFSLIPQDIEKINETLQHYDWINPNLINVSLHGEGNKNTYTTLKQAENNSLAFTPSPNSLARALLKEPEPFIKPIRLIKKGNYYDLIEGRIRYWAWVMAFGNRPISAYIRQNWNKEK